MSNDLNIIKDAIETLIGGTDRDDAVEKGEHALNLIAGMRHVCPDVRVLRKQNAITVEGLKRRIDCLVLDMGKLYPMAMEEQSDRIKLDMAGKSIRELSKIMTALHSDLESREY